MVNGGNVEGVCVVHLKVLSALYEALLPCDAPGFTAKAAAAVLEVALRQTDRTKTAAAP